MAKTPRKTRRKKTPPKRPPATPPKPSSPAALDEIAVQDQITVLVATLTSRAAVEKAASEKLGLTADQAHAMITHAYAAILAAAFYHKQQAAGQAMIRLHDLYERSLQIQDVKTALAAQKELNRLYDLYTFRPPAAGDREAPPETARGSNPQPDKLQGLRLLA